MDFDGASRRVETFDFTEGLNEENEETWCNEGLPEDSVNERLRSSGDTGAETGV